MRVLGIIPARGGSKGVPRKNIKLLGNKPLIYYTINSVRKSTLLTHTILSSEDEEIIKIAKNFDLDVPFKRPNALASDESPTIETVIHALEHFKSIDIHFDAVCLLQVTSPFKNEGFIDKAIQKFEKANTDSLISVLEVPHEYNPHWIFEENTDGNLQISTGEKQIITRRQNLPKSFYRDGAIYITKTDVILNKKSLYGDSISYIESDKAKHVNIDTIDDWKKAELILSNLKL